MDEQLSMAREEEERLPVLLVGKSGRENKAGASSRDKGKESHAPIGVRQRGKVEDIKSKGKGSSKAEGDNGGPSRPRKHKRDDKGRKSDRILKGEDSQGRRSASELAIVHPGSFCIDDVITGNNPHYWEGVETIHGGTLFRCGRCHKHLWLPNGEEEIYQLGSLVNKVGITNGYCQYLDLTKRRPAKIMMAKLQLIERESVEVEDRMEFARKIDRILYKKDYDKKEV
ncbi:hypothetical protein LCGC14_0408720 [marine sediment metagenome]|uniref:Uncharacterized protein n=1 Tax=marine sediment metagenome TaxID=412755 RepID=A0A0F9SUH0_9ZZZZ